MSEELTLTLNSPITDEQWDMLTDIDFDNTDSIIFYTKHGKEVEFVKRKTGRWEYLDYGGFGNWHCTSCRKIAIVNGNEDFCPNCGARMEADHETD